MYKEQVDMGAGGWGCASLLFLNTSQHLGHPARRLPSEMKKVHACT